MDSYMIDLDDALSGTGTYRIWHRAEDLQFGNRIDTTLGDSSACRPAVGPFSLHTYNGVQYTGNGHIVWTGGFSYCVGSPGEARIINVNTPTASGLLTFTAQPANGDTVTIGARTYTFKVVVSSTVANEVLIGADADTSMVNLRDAINRTGTAGTQYSSPTVINADVTADSDAVSNTMAMVTKTPGATLTLSDTSANIFWDYLTTKSRWTWSANYTTYQGYGGINSTAVSGQYLYVVKNTSANAKLDKDTLAIVASRTGIAAVRHNGVNMPTSSGSFNAAQGSAAVNDNGFFCMVTNTAALCSNTLGTTADANNDDSWGRFIRRPVSSMPAAVQSVLSTGTGNGVAAITGSDGWLAIYTGVSRSVVLFRPDPQPFNRASDGGACTNAELAGTCGYDGDQFQVFTPSTGPALLGSGGLIYNKFHYWADKGVLVGLFSSRSEASGGGIWMFNPGFGIGGVNHPPVAVDDTITGVEDVASITGNVVTNDTDPDGDALTARVVTDPYTGLLSLAPSGSLTYVPPPNFNGAVPFEYEVSDGNATDIGVATINVTPVNDVPVAADDAFPGIENTVLTGNVRQNDSDPVEGTSLTVTVVTPPSTGSGFVLGTNGNFTYTPPDGFIGDVTFTYQVSDGADTDTATATMSFASSGGGGGGGDTPDFLSRASSPGVIFSQGFDPGTVVANDSRTIEGMYLNGTTVPDATRTLPVVQDGHLHFAVKSGSRADSAGQYYVQFSDLLGHEIGYGQTIHVQWRQYMDQGLTDTKYWQRANQFVGINDPSTCNGTFVDSDPLPGTPEHNNACSQNNTTPKLLIVSHEGTTSCTAGHVVVVQGSNQDTGWGDALDGGVQKNRMSMYSDCGSFTSFAMNAGGSNTDTQVVLHPDADAYIDAMAAAFKINPQGTSTDRLCYTNNRANCVVIPANHWVTYSLTLRMATADKVNTDPGGNTRVPIYATLRMCGGIIGNNGLSTGATPSTSCVTVFDSIKNVRGFVSTGSLWGRMWWLPYMTGKASNQSPADPDTYTDIDEVIISTQPIPDPAEYD